MQCDVSFLKFIKGTNLHCAVYIPVSFVIEIILITIITTQNVMESHCFLPAHGSRLVGDIQRVPGPESSRPVGDVHRLPGPDGSRPVGDVHWVPGPDGSTLPGVGCHHFPGGWVPLQFGFGNSSLVCGQQNISWVMNLGEDNVETVNNGELHKLHDLYKSHSRYPLEICVLINYVYKSRPFVGIMILSKS